MATLKHVGKAIANREDLTPEHGKAVSKGVMDHKIKTQKAKEAKKATAKPPAKKASKNGKKGK